MSPGGSGIDAVSVARMVAAGTSDAEAALCRAFAPRIWAYGIRHLRQEQDAADLTQAVLLAVIEALRAGKVREPEQIGSYVLGTARQMVTDLRRTRRRRTDLIERFCATFQGSVEQALPETARVADCLAQLTHTARRVMVMTFFEDASSQEIAEALAVSPGNVRVIRHRALDALRDCVEPPPAQGRGEA